MKTWTIPIGLILMASCGYSGNHASDNAVMADSTAQAACAAINLDGTTPEDHATLSHAICSDTVFMKNGGRVVCISATSPMNVSEWWVDRKGAPLIVYSKASECDAQILTFVYRNDGRIDHVKEDISDWSHDIVNQDADSLLSVIQASDRHETFDTGSYREYWFRYDDNGRLMQILKRHDSDDASTMANAISATTGYHLEGDFRPGYSFWMSDLHGGFMNLYCHEIPNKPDCPSYSERRWMNFHPVSELRIENGMVTAGKLYLSHYPEDHVEIKGQKDVETETFNREHAWEEEFGSPVNFDNPPSMPMEYFHCPKSIPLNITKRTRQCACLRNH